MKQDNASCIVPLPAAFADERGTIQNIAGGEFGGFVRMFSKAGSRRSAHWHRTDHHYMYIESGRMRYRERKVGTETVIEATFGPGQLVYTGPNTEHWCEFEQDTVIFYVSKLFREHATHEADLVRVDWLDG